MTKWYNFAAQKYLIFVNSAGFGGEYCLSLMWTEEWWAKRASLFSPETFEDFWSQKERRKKQNFLIMKVQEL
jgi:hypothetical protein